MRWSTVPAFLRCLPKPISVNKSSPLNQFWHLCWKLRCRFLFICRFRAGPGSFDRMNTARHPASGRECGIDRRILTLSLRGQTSLGGYRGRTCTIPTGYRPSPSLLQRAACPPRSLAQLRHPSASLGIFSASTQWRSQNPVTLASQNHSHTPYPQGLQTSNAWSQRLFQRRSLQQIIRSVLVYQHKICQCLWNSNFHMNSMSRKMMKYHKI